LLVLLVALLFSLIKVSSAISEVVIQFILPLLSIFVYSYQESSSWQATIGKKLFGIVVTNAEGNRLSFMRAFGRNFAKIISAIPLFIGFIMVGMTAKKQGLHDMIADTVVTKNAPTRTGLALLVFFGPSIIGGIIIATMAATIFGSFMGGMKSSESVDIIGDYNSYDYNEDLIDSTEITRSDVTIDSFAQCLADEGAVFYGAFWCEHCQTQKEIFGKSAFSKLTYVECSTPDGEGQTQVCQDEDIQGYPTWKFADGSVESQVMNSTNLSEKTGCKAPE
jgi:hypothetical protein